MGALVGSVVQPVSAAEPVIVTGETAPSVQQDAQQRVSAAEPLIVTAETAPSAQQDAQVQAAILRAYAGLEHFKRSEYEAASVAFEESLRLAASPVVWVYLARSQKALGHWLSAQQSYARAVATVTEESNAIWASARVGAQHELEELQRSQPSVALRFEGASADQLLLLSLDGRPLVPSSSLRFSLDPGQHVVIGSVSGQTVRVSFVIRAAESKEVTLEFKVKASAPALAVRGTPRGPKEPGAGKTLTPWVWTSLGVAGGAALLGLIAGVHALDWGNDLRAWCDREACPKNIPNDEQMAGKYYDAKTAATASNVAFVVSGIAGAVGVTLLVLDGQNRRMQKLGVRGNALVWEGTF